MKRILVLAAILLAAISCAPAPVVEPEPEPEPPKAVVVTARVDGKTVASGGKLGGVSLNPVISLEFTSEVKADEASLEAVSFSGGTLSVQVSPSDATVLLFSPVTPLESLHTYQFDLAEGACFGIRLKKAFSFSFTTQADDTSDKFPRISDEELLTLVQQQTFQYFWDHAHPVSGLARERLGSGNTVTTGGSGFGIMCLPVAVSRGFISRADAAVHMRKILAFLQKADRFHGVFPHWIDGESGKVIPFSANDNGGDLVETAFLMQGLLTVAQFFDAADEADIRAGVRTLWEEVEWDWYTHGKEVLYWHWSPTAEWAMNMPVRGWNEGLIVYVLAASSPTHPVSADIYHKGWASGGKMKPSVDGPLFFAHYSFLGLDPRGLSDTYCADYFAQNVAHAQYNYDYCVRNPRNHAGYSSVSWGLTASDYPGGYTASAPSNDHGTIAPTAAVASLPYLPEQSLDAIRYFYYKLGDRLWSKYGFKDAFCLDSGWFASSYIAIDQGPIVVMIENYRTGLLWRLFMQDPAISAGLEKLGFSREKS